MVVNYTLQNVISLSVNNNIFTKQRSDAFEVWRDLNNDHFLKKFIEDCASGRILTVDQYT